MIQGMSTKKQQEELVAKGASQTMNSQSTLIWVKLSDIMAYVKTDGQVGNLICTMTVFTHRCNQGYLPLAQVSWCPYLLRNAC